jgi:uncharacterized protein with von Willebrand factor type A (vWA) domain
VSSEAISNANVLFTKRKITASANYLIKSLTQGSTKKDRQEEYAEVTEFYAESLLVFYGAIRPVKQIGRRPRIGN